MFVFDTSIVKFAAINRPVYRAYSIGSGDCADDFVSIQCSDDHAAIIVARQLIDSYGLELWDGNRKILSFEANPSLQNSLKQRLTFGRSGI